MFFDISCSNSNCTIIGSNTTSSRKILLRSQLALALLGVSLNSLSFYNLLSKNFFKIINKKFFNYIRLYILNSLIINLNDLVVLIYLFFWQKTVFIYKLSYLHASEKFVYYYAYIYLPLWGLTYTCSGLINICIVIQRIQLISLKSNFLRNTPLWFCLLMILIYSTIINIPVSFSREVTNLKLAIDNQQDNVTELFLLEASGDNKIFLYIIYGCNFVRDVLTPLVTLFTNIYLIILIKIFLARKMRFRMNVPTTSRFFNNNVSLREIRNSVFSLTICFFSIINNLFVYSLSFAMLNNFYTYYYYAIMFVGCVHNFIHSLNFFILLVLNKQFRTQFSKYFIKLQSLSSIRPRNNDREMSMEFSTNNAGVVLLKFKKNMNMIS